jgi:serine/threonine protein kinase
MNMIANQVPCLETETLADLLAGRLPPDRFVEAMEHVDTCALCTRAAETLSQEEPSHWVKHVLQGEGLPLYDHEPECHAVVGNLLLQPSQSIKSQSNAPLPIPTLGPYRLLKWLGAGGMGAVYLAEHQRLKRMAAIKLLPREKSLQPGWLERFNREMTSVAALEHPHVVRALDAGEDGAWHYLVMEYLDGADLSKVCRRMGELSLATSCELIRQAALGLDAIHSLGMTHRDIKPSNLFLTRAGTVKLLDLGLVLSGDSPLVSDERLTTVGHLMGTLPYMAREQLMDASGVDWRADIYSLGATFFRLLTGRPPYGQTKNLAMAVQAISNGPCPSIATLKRDLPAEVIQVIDRMLSHDPAVRPKSALEVARSLAPYCDEKAPQALIRVVMQKGEREEEESSGILHANSHPIGSIQHANLVDGHRNGNMPRWPWWIAAGISPLLFFAGIFITIATDRGTLIIESDEPGINVTISQGEKVIEAMRVEQGSTSLKLQSGKYQIELTGVENDVLVMSESQVFLMRGDKQIIKIRRESSDSTAANKDSKEPSATRYQGKTFEQWKVVLATERDIATVAQAMQALKLLAETDAEKATAARLCLLPARQWGGIVMSNRPQPQSRVAPNHSDWFMTELTEIFPSFLPEPGITAIIEELENGNKRSAQACLLLVIRNLEKSETLDYGGGAARPNDHYDLVELIEKQEGRAKVNRLIAAMSKWIDNRRIIIDETSYFFARAKLRLMDLLGMRLDEDAQVVVMAKELSKAADEVIAKRIDHLSMAMAGGGMSGSHPRAVSHGRSPLDAWTALMISRTLDGFPGISVPLGLLEPVNRLKLDYVEKQLKAFDRYAREYPKETTLAVIAHLDRLDLEGPKSGGGGGFGIPTTNPRSEKDTRSKIAKELLLNVKDDLARLNVLLRKAREYPDPSCIFSKDELDELLQNIKSVSP